MKLTDVVPNLIVADIDRSAAFYRDVLGFSTVTTVPPDRAAGPFVFVWMQRGDVSVFLNAAQGVDADLPVLASRPIGGTATLFITVEPDGADGGVEGLCREIDGRAPVVMPLRDQFYGMREFAITDPDGYVLIFAQRIA